MTIAPLHNLLLICCPCAVRPYHDPTVGAHHTATVLHKRCGCHMLCQHTRTLSTPQLTYLFLTLCATGRPKSGLRPVLELQTGRNSTWQPCTSSPLALQHLAYNVNPRRQVFLRDLCPEMMATFVDMTCVLLWAGSISNSE